MSSSLPLSPAPAYVISPPPAYVSSPCLNRQTHSLSVPPYNMMQPITEEEEDDFAALSALIDKVVFTPESVQERLFSTLPKKMNPNVKLEEIKLERIDGHDGFSALLFLLALGTSSFAKIISTCTAHEGLNKSKSLMHRVHQRFLREGYLETTALTIGCLEKWCHVKSAIKPPSYKSIVAQYRSPSADIMKSLLEDPELKASEPSPKAEEYISNFLKTFNIDGEFAAVSFEDGFSGTTREYCKKMGGQIQAANTVVFVRPSEWGPNQAEAVFPSPQVQIGDHMMYQLKGIMLFNPYADLDEMSYHSYIVEDDGVIFAYPNDYDPKVHACTRIDKVIEDFAAIESLYMSSQLPNPKKLEENLEVLVKDIIYYGELFLYEKI